VGGVARRIEGTFTRGRTAATGRVRRLAFPAHRSLVNA
jgi:hypothetical protein